MKNLIKLSLLAIFIGIHPIGCVKEEIQHPCAGENFATLVKAESFAKHYSSISFFNGSTINLGNWVDSSGYYHRNDIALSFSIDETKRIAQQSHSLGIGNNAYACSPGIPKVDNKISNIDIIYRGDSLFYNNTFDTFMNGDTISDLFEYAFNRYNQYPSEAIRPLKDFLPQEQSLYDELILKVAFTSKEDSLTLNFDIILTDSNGGVFEFNRSAFNLRWRA
ncbi:hypothetical protein [Owenweeksia hongkongensis]|uniref:hypothetical protein n=1 Tax=Owenweeksia hongkongensis TaxID=253245 RepID=UPI003A94E0BB